MQKILLAPYPADTSISYRLKFCLVVSLFVFLFLYVYRPFGMEAIEENAFLVILGYGGVCFIMMAFLNLGLPSLAVRFFSEYNWKIWKELLWTILNLVFIGLVTALYSFKIGFFGFNTHFIIMFETYTLEVGLIPICVGILIKRARYEQRFLRKSEEINTSIQNQQDHLAAQPVLPETINIPSQNLNENLSVAVSDLLYIRAADNYVEVFFMDQDKLKSKLIRNTISNMSTALSDFPQFFRCHKSYLVNLKMVNHVSGNAQGLKLRLQNTEDLVPVSRDLTKTIREKLLFAH